MMAKVLRIIIFFLLVAPLAAYCQPSNDNCSSAKVMVLDTVASCQTSSGGFNQGGTTTLTAQTNVGATASAPYPYISACPISINNTPKDVWYSFVATGLQTTVSVSGATGTLTSPTITFWGGTCGNLEGLGCASGSGGAATLTVYQTVPGQTYYVQVAGADSTQVGTFTISASCASNCAACVLGSYITPSVLPVNGTYFPGQTVTFCFTVTQYNEVNSNWLHGITPTFGPGWNLATLIVDSVPPSCTTSTGASWGWYPGDTSSYNDSIFGAGFYYETSAGNANATLDSTPGNNFGDQMAGQGTCSPTFCITITAYPTDTPGTDLSISFATSGDGESGSWSQPGCGAGVDSTTTLHFISSCAPPIMSTHFADCNHNNGIDTATPVGNYAPFIFHWSNGFIDTTNGAPSVITGLAPGVYNVTVTNVENCRTSNSDTVFVAPRPHGGGDKYVSCPSLIDSTVMTAAGIGTWAALPGNPASTIIDNIDSPNTVIRNFTTYGTYFYSWQVGFCFDTIAVIVSSRPDAGPDVHACINGTATMAAVGTGTWTALSGNPAPTVIANPIANNTAISGFTVGGTYSYIWFVGTCTDTAKVIVPVFTSSATTADTVLCKYKSTTLSAAAGPAGLAPFTYAWLPASSVVSSTSASTSTTPVLGPTHYVVAVTATGGCVLYDTVFIDISGAAPRIAITPSDNNVCPGDTITLTSSALAENLVYCGTVDTCVTNNNLVSFAVNNDTSSTTGSPFGFTAVDCSPFMGSYNCYKAQYLFTKAELNAAGLSSGSITDISFFVKQVNSTVPYDTFAVSMGCTDLDSLTNFVNNVVEVVPPQMGPNAITPNEGWTPLPFTHFYNWDGSSNLVIQICYTIDPSQFSQDDYVSYSTTSYNGSCIIGADFSGTANGCSIDSASVSLTGFYQVLNTRPNVKFGQCVPNVLTYKWVPHTILCDTCPVTQVVVNANSTYTLTVNDNGCSNDTLVNLTINPNIGVAATPAVATVCGGSGVQLNVALSNPPASQCVQGYSVASIPYAPINGVARVIPPVAFEDQFGDPYSIEDGTAGPFNIGFNFPLYCETFSQFYVNSNGWISFVYPYPFINGGDEYTAQTLPSADPQPQKAIELMMGGYILDDSFGFGGGHVSYFVSGTAPNRVLVIQFSDMQDFSELDTTSGEMHLYEGSGVVDILLTYSDYSGTQHTTGIADSSGLGIAAPGMNNQMYTVTTPVAWRFTPQNGPSVAIASTVWSPNQNLSNDTITNPIASPTTPQQYIVTDTLIINQFTHPTKCVVKDTVQVNIGHSGGGTATASPATLCPGTSSQLTFTSPDTIVSYSWTPSSGLSDSVIADPTAIVADTTAFIITAINSQGCRIIDTVTVQTIPVATITLPENTSVCDCTPHDTLVPTITGGTGAVSYQWSDGTTGSTTIDTSIGTVRYTLTVTDANHCTVVSNTDTISMNCPRAAISVRPVSDTIFVHDTAVLTATMVPGYSYLWTGDTTITVLTPTVDSTPVIGQVVGIDTVRLLVTDGNGCTYNAIQVVNVVEFGNFAMATAFTPNGDGKNDNFYPALEGPVKISKFNIYDRWGQLVYDNPNPPGWDGNFKGKQEPSETYIYFITVEYPDPSDASRTIQRSVQGSFQLFR